MLYKKNINLWNCVSVKKKKIIELYSSISRILCNKHICLLRDYTYVVHLWERIFFASSLFTPVRGLFFPMYFCFCFKWSWSPSFEITRYLSSTSHEILQKNLDEALNHLLFIRDVHASSLGQDTDSPKWGLSLLF